MQSGEFADKQSGLDFKRPAWLHCAGKRLYRLDKFEPGWRWFNGLWRALGI
jgi:hypothetical protein